jgi:hypothetical protein
VLSLHKIARLLPLPNCCASRVKGEPLLLQGAQGAVAAAQDHLPAGARAHAPARRPVLSPQASPDCCAVRTVPREGMALLQPVYGRFTEGFDTAVNAGGNMHRRAGVKMHHGRMGEVGRRGGALVQATSPQTQLSSSINEPASPSRPGITLSTARSVGDGRSGATRSTASMASTGPSPQRAPWQTGRQPGFTSGAGVACSV